MGTDLVRTSADIRQVSGLERAKQIIRRSDDPAEIADVHSLAAAAAIYAEAQGAREQYLQASEIKLLAERKVGALRLSFPRIYPRSFDREKARGLRESGMTFKKIGERLCVSGTAIRRASLQGWREPKLEPEVTEFDQNFAVSRSLLLEWEKLSKIPQEVFEQLLTQAREEDLSMSAKSFLRRYGQVSEIRLEPCIYRRQSDDRLTIRWSKGGVSRHKTLDTQDVAVARKELAKARGTIKQTVPANARTLGDAYSLVRRALQALDTLTPRLEPESKKATKAAIGYLHKAEDEIVKASNSIPVGKPGRPKTRS